MAVGGKKYWFAARVVAVKKQYGLTVDRREAAALERALSGCASTALVIAECAALVTTRRPRTGAVDRGNPLEIWDDNGNGRIMCGGGAGAWDRADGAGTSSVSVHERRGRGGLRIKKGSI